MKTLTCSLLGINYSVFYCSSFANKLLNWKKILLIEFHFFVYTSYYLCSQPIFHSFLISFDSNSEDAPKQTNLVRPLAPDYHRRHYIISTSQILRVSFFTRVLPTRTTVDPKICTYERRSARVFRNYDDGSYIL